MDPSTQEGRYGVRPNETKPLFCGSAEVATERISRWPGRCFGLFLLSPGQRHKIKILLRSGLGCGMISPERYFRGSASWFEAALKLYLWEVLQ